MCELSCSQRSAAACVQLFQLLYCPSSAPTVPHQCPNSAPIVPPIVPLLSRPHRRPIAAAPSRSHRRNRRPPCCVPVSSSQLRPWLHLATCVKQYMSEHHGQLCGREVKLLASHEAVGSALLPCNSALAHGGVDAGCTSRATCMRSNARAPTHARMPASRPAFSDRTHMCTATSEVLLQRWA